MKPRVPDAVQHIAPKARKDAPQIRDRSKFNL